MVTALLAATTLWVLLALLPWACSYAAGTAAGTSINNAAQLQYTQGINTLTANSNTASFRVDEIINVRVTAPAVPATVFSPDQNKALLFLVTNVGNGPESFNLNVNLAPSVADQFDPLPGGTGQLFIDVNGNGTFEPGTDTPVSGPVTIAPDQSLRVLVVSNIPAGRNNGDLGVVTLTAVSATPGAAAAPVGTILAGAGTPVGGGPPVNAIIGVGAAGRPDSGSDDAANGAYQVEVWARSAGSSTEHSCLVGPAGTSLCPRPTVRAAGPFVAHAAVRRRLANPSMNGEAVLRWTFI